MTKATEEILAKAMSLTETERAELTDRLLDTFGPGADPDYVASWRVEIRRRLDEHESGRTTAVPWESARKQIFQAGNGTA
jgi:putative addiction module component (TIGR02574 family)